MSDSETYEKIMATNALIENELDKWEKQGIHPKNVEIDPFLLDCLINALVQFLAEKEIVDGEELTLYYKKHLLTQLTAMREQVVEPALQEMRRQQIVNGLPTQDIPKKRPMH